MTYAVCFELTDGRIICNDHVTGAERPSEVEREITRGDGYVVSNSKKHIRVRRDDVYALTIELRGES